MRRFIAVIINIASAVVAVLALSMIQIKYTKNAQSTILSSPTFEKSEEFSDILNGKIDDVFLYIQLKNCFETNNQLNYDITVAESIDSNDEIKKWTIKECIDAAVAHGLYIDTDYTINTLVDQNTIPFSKNNVYNFIFKSYPSNIRIGTSTEEDFLTDFMYCYAKYTRCQRTLDDNNSNFKYKVIYFDEFGNETRQYANTDLSNKEILGTDSFIYLTSKDNIISSNLSVVNNSILKKAKQMNPIMDENFAFYSTIDKNYPCEDAFKQSYTNYMTGKQEFAVLTTTAFYSTIIFLVSLFFTLMFILATKKQVDESKRLFYSIPTEFYVLLYIICIAVGFFIVNKFVTTARFGNYELSTAKVNLFLLIIYCTSIMLFTVLASKYENDTLTPISIKALRENSEYGETDINVNLLFFTIFIPIVLFIFLSIYMFYLFSMTNDIRILITGIILLLCSIGFVIYVLMLHNAFSKAIQVQVRSNEMRTSLIANVSHDIKTPLTSILNYTNLITDEINNFNKSSKKNLEKYSEVIVNKSHRLNDLINDLIFDSKVTSGNVEMDMVPIDLNQFLTQIIAEFTDRLAERGLKIIYNNDATNTHILADSSQLYRVFQNLFSNIYKYALENSRVYVDLNSNKSKTVVTIKNIQQEKLEVNADTLKDRFVRGSKSRTTEGFGLGLSISENLVNSMNGKLDIMSVRDLFTAKLTFVGYEA